MGLRDPALRLRIDRLKNFGIADQETVELAGINGNVRLTRGEGSAPATASSEKKPAKSDSATRSSQIVQ